MANKWQRRLIKFLMRSLDETPYDWTYRNGRFRNEHLKISILFNPELSSAASIRILRDGASLIESSPTRLFMAPWRPRMILAMRAAEKNAEIARATQAVEDTLDPLDTLQSTARMIAYFRALGVMG